MMLSPFPLDGMVRYHCIFIHPDDTVVDPDAAASPVDLT